MDEKTYRIEPCHTPSLRSSRGGETFGEVGRMLGNCDTKEINWGKCFKKEKSGQSCGMLLRGCVRTDQFYVQLSLLTLASPCSPGFSSSSSPTLSPSWAPDVNPKVLPFFYFCKSSSPHSLCHSLACPIDSSLNALALRWPLAVHLTLPGTSSPAFHLCSIMAKNWSWKSGQKHPQPPVSIASLLSLSNSIPWVLWSWLFHGSFSSYSY